MTNSNLNTLSCTNLKGVGDKVAEKLEKIGIFTLQDLLFHLPLRYQDRTRIAPIATLRIGDYAVIDGVIEHIELSQKRREALVVTVKDYSGFIKLRFFHFTVSQQKSFAVNMRIRCFGEVRRGYYGLEIVHPEYRRIFSNEPLVVEENLTPIYPTTEGLSQNILRNLTSQALNLLTEKHFISEFMPQEILDKFSLYSIEDAIQFVHRPPPDVNLAQLEAGIHPAQKRLAFEELLAHHLSLRKLRVKMEHHKAYALNDFQALVSDFEKLLPFKLTNAQQRVIKEIQDDLQKAQPMMRLVQGDVGSGKTLVAAMAMMQAVACGYQAALMAPTDILAEQHAHNFQKWLSALNISMAWLAGKHKGKTREKLINEIASGEAKIIIGTHAIFQEGVSFKNLALIVIDEQHRFGVDQRLALREKGKQENDIYPHQLIMTATPIPRTLAMTAYADLDVSVVDELPPGRTPVKTVVIPSEKRFEVVERIRNNCLHQKQVYWVCTLIDESEVLQAQAAEATYKQLSILLNELRIGLIHGRLKSSEKEEIMQQFKNAELDLLIATTVIEVGVDVPNASLMIIENAERLGLSQLHQLRGRVGRGSTESFCVLLYQSPLSDMAKSRLHVMRETTDGFEIAKQDLELRGPGEFLGTKQTGLVRYRIADLTRDQDLLNDVPIASEILLRNYPEISDKLICRWLFTGEKFAGV